MDRSSAYKWATVTAAVAGVAALVTPDIRSWWFAIPLWLLAAWCGWRWLKTAQQAPDDSLVAEESDTATIGDVDTNSVKLTFATLKTIARVGASWLVPAVSLWLFWTTVLQPMRYIPESERIYVEMTPDQVLEAIWGDNRTSREADVIATDYVGK